MTASVSTTDPTTDEPAVHRSLLVVDIEKFSDPRRTNRNQRAIRAGMYGILVEAFTRIGIPWSACEIEDRGDSVFIRLPAAIAKAPLVDDLPGAVVTALVTYNANSVAEEQIRLRMALHAGEVEIDSHGATAAAINLLFRLVEARQLKEALAGSPGVLALITSDWFFTEVVRNSGKTDATTFRKHEVHVKETRATGWISLPDQPYPPEAPVAAPPAADWTVTISTSVALSVTRHRDN